MSPITALFAVTLVLESLMALLLLLSMLYPKYRVWPPPKKNSWQYWFNHILFYPAILGFLVLGILDWNSFFLAHSLRFVFASILIAMGATVSLWAIRTLTVSASLGLKGELVTEGPYKYSRNPQYVGFFLSFAGLVLVFNSVYASITFMIGTALFILTPLVEEPWLKQRFGREYEDYCENVPRFVGLRSFGR